MTRKQADAAFDSLRRHSSAITAPSDPAEALKLLDRAVLTQLQRDAMVHYIAVGPDNLALAYSVLKAGAATFASARVAGGATFASARVAGGATFAGARVAGGATFAGAPVAGGESSPVGPTDPAGDRELFAARMIALDEALADAEPAERATRLLDAFTGHVAAGRERLSAEDPGEPDASAEGSAARVGDLLEAAGIAYVIGQLLESPPGPVATRR